MQIKLPDDVAKKFAGKSPEDIVAILREHNPEAAAAFVVVEDFKALTVRVDAMSAIGDRLADVEARLKDTQAAVGKAINDAVEQSTKIVTSAISKLGVPAPLAGGNSATDGSNSADAAGTAGCFAATVVELKKTMSPAAALNAAIKRDLAAYTAWRNAGCIPAV